MSSTILGFGFVILHKDFHFKKSRFGYFSQILHARLAGVQVAIFCANCPKGRITPPFCDSIPSEHICNPGVSSLRTRRQGRIFQRLRLLVRGFCGSRFHRFSLEHFLHFFVCGKDVLPSHFQHVSLIISNFLSGDDKTEHKHLPLSFRFLNYTTELLFCQEPFYKRVANFFQQDASF